MSNSKKQWDRYIKYLIFWAIDHQGKEYAGMTPVCFDEFCDNESDNDKEWYDNALDYDEMQADLNDLVDRFRRGK